MIRGSGVTHFLTNSPHVCLLSFAPTPSSFHLHKVQEVGRKTLLLLPQASSETPHRLSGVCTSCCMCEGAACTMMHWVLRAAERFIVTVLLWTLTDPHISPSSSVSLSLRWITIPGTRPTSPLKAPCPPLWLISGR